MSPGHRALVEQNFRRFAIAVEHLVKEEHCAPEDAIRALVRMWFLEDPQTWFWHDPVGKYDTTWLTPFAQMLKEKGGIDVAVILAEE